MADEPVWTEAGLRKIKATGKREQFPDPTMRGLVLLMTPSGVKTFYLVYRVGGGRAGKKRWFKVGRLGLDGGLEWARGEAEKLRGKIRDGSDPQGARKEARSAKPETTVADLCDRFEEKYLDAGKVRPSTAIGYKQHIKAHIRPCYNNTTSDLRAANLDNTIIANRCGSIDLNTNYTLTNNSTTPAVGPGARQFFKCANSSTTTITNFTGGTEFREIEILFSNGNTTLSHGTILLKGATNVTPAANSSMRFRYFNTNWYEVSRSF